MEHARVDEEANTSELDEETQTHHRARFAVERKPRSHEAR